jgi:hypothetical protein
MFFNKSGGCHNETGRAEAALHRTFVHIGFLNGGHFTVLDFAFYGSDCSSTHPHGQIDTGINRLTIHQYGACAALSHGAPLLHAGQSQLFPQYFK